MNLHVGCNGAVVAGSPEGARELWRTSLATAGIVSSTSRADGCVLADDGRVYAGCHGHLFALHGGTGEVLWHNELRGLG